MVDLAGSERAKDTGAEGKRLQVRRDGMEKGEGEREGREGEREREKKKTIMWICILILA